MNWTNNLEKDICFDLGSRYYLKRYAYFKANFMDENGKKINERVFSFMLYRGENWFNDTCFRLRESELYKALELASQHKDRKEKERRFAILAERKARSVYPIKHDFVFDNVVISVIEDVKYYGKYFSATEKIIDIYANGHLLQFCNFTKPYTFVPSKQWVFENIVNLTLTRYQLPEKAYKKVNKVKIEASFVPLNFYIGLVVSLGGHLYKIKDCFAYGNEFGFKTDKGNVNISFDQLLGVEVIGELQGVELLSALLNKRKYVI